MTECVLVTGGSRGIGLELVGQLRSSGYATLSPTRYECDMESIQSVMNYRFPAGISVIVLCAGTMGKTRFLETQRTVDGLDKCFQVNFLSQALLCLKKPHSVHTIVFVSSQAANHVSPDGNKLIRQYAGHTKLKSYAASKCCMHLFMEIYQQMCPGTQCVCVDPGNVHTDMVKPIYQTNRLLAWIKRWYRKNLTFNSVEEAATWIIEQRPMTLNSLMSNADAVYNFVHHIYQNASSWKSQPPLFNTEHSAFILLVLVVVVVVVVLVARRF